MVQCGSSGKFCCDVAYYDPNARTIFSTVPSIYSFCYNLIQGLHWSLTTFILSPLLHKTLSIGDNVGEKIWRSEKGKERNRQRIDRPAWESISEQRDKMLLLKYKSRVWHKGAKLTSKTSRHPAAALEEVAGCLMLTPLLNTLDLWQITSLDSASASSAIKHKC